MNKKYTFDKKTIKFLVKWDSLCYALYFSVVVLLTNLDLNLYSKLHTIQNVRTHYTEI